MNVETWLDGGTEPHIEKEIIASINDGSMDKQSDTKSDFTFETEQTNKSNKFTMPFILEMLESFAQNVSTYKNPPHKVNDQMPRIYKDNKGEIICTTMI